MAIYQAIPYLVPCFVFVSGVDSEARGMKLKLDFLKII